MCRLRIPAFFFYVLEGKDNTNKYLLLLLFVYFLQYGQRRECNLP